MTARFRCLKCGHRWEGRPGPVECPKCHHLYVVWEDFDDA